MGLAGFQFGPDGFNDEPTIDVYCPRCGAGHRFSQSDWDASMGPKTEVVNDGRNILTTWVETFNCDACGQKTPPKDWHRARERTVMAAKGFMTPRMVKEASR